MNNFSIGEAWSQAVAILQRDMNMLLTYVGGSVLAATLLQIVVLGINPDVLSQQLASSISGGNPQAVLETMLPAFIGGTIVASVIQSAGQFAAFRNILSQESDVGGLLAYGFTAAIVSLLFWIVIGVAAAVLIGLLLVAFGAGALATGDPSTTMGAVGILLTLIFLLLPLILWLATRLWVTAPAMANERSINPLFGIAQAWRLSSGSNQWPMLGYLLLLIIAAVVIFGIVGVIAGVFSALAGSTIGAVVTSLLTGIPAGILGVAINGGVFRALSPPDQGQIFA